MPDVTTNRGQDEVELSAADEQLLRELTERARTGGLKLTGEGGLLGKLTKMVIEGALEGELDDHLGYEKNDPAGRDGGNSRNGRRAHWRSVMNRLCGTVPCCGWGAVTSCSRPWVVCVLCGCCSGNVL